ncbi:MAG: hypothetical protein IKT00_13775 [Prevotella sp.]|nr:hypothetical protein [Prevotella sp.]MBR4390226.1 hypothetical protein [Prevotella sp.]
MKKEYIAPIAGYTERMTSDNSNRPGFGVTSRGAVTMHTNDSFFEEDTNEENWAQVGSLWDE